MTDELRPAAVPGLPLASLVPGASGVLTYHAPHAARLLNG